MLEAKCLFILLMFLWLLLLVIIFIVLIIWKLMKKHRTETFISMTSMHKREIELNTKNKEHSHSDNESMAIKEWVTATNTDYAETGEAPSFGHRVEDSLYDNIVTGMEHDQDDSVE
eukprot:400152_1